MKKTKTVILALLTAALILGGFKSLPLSFVVKADDIGSAELYKKELEKRKEDTQKKIAELEKEKGDIVSYIEKLDVQLNDLVNQIKTLEGQIEETKAQIKLTKVDLKEAKQLEKKQYDTMKKRIKYMYENGSNDYLDILFQAADLADLLNRAEHIAEISEYDNTLFERYKKTKEEVENKESELSNKLEELEVLNDSLTFEMETVQNLADDKKDEVEKYNVTISSSKAKVSEVDDEIARQEQLIEDLLEQERQRIEEQMRKEEEQRRLEEERKRQEEEKRKQEEQRKEEEQRRLEEQKRQEEKKKEEENKKEGGGKQEETAPPQPTPVPTQQPTPTPVPTQAPAETPDTSGSVSFSWPLPVSGRINSPFGNRVSPTAGASSNHKGVDIGVPTGTNILAAAGGSVVTASYQAAAGNYIMIYHGNSTYTVYMHCSKLLVSVGDNVNRGDVIAYSGASGIVTGPHLHFGISINGAYVDPLKYVHS